MEKEIVCIKYHVHSTRLKAGFINPRFNHCEAILQKVITKTKGKFWNNKKCLSHTANYMLYRISFIPKIVHKFHLNHYPSLPVSIILTLLRSYPPQPWWASPQGLWPTECIPWWQYTSFKFGPEEGSSGSPHHLMVLRFTLGSTYLRYLLSQKQKSRTICGTNWESSINIYTLLCVK